MAAYLVLLIAVLSRILPHTFHEVNWNFTAVGGGLLFFGSRLRASNKVPGWGAALKIVSAVAVLVASDYYLTLYAYQYPFHPNAYIVTWFWYGAICILGMGLLGETSALRVAIGVFASATSFFLLSNFTVWAGGTMYPTTLSGLGECMAAGLPFYRNDLLSTAITAGALFGLPVLATRIIDIVEAAQNNNLPMA